MTSTPTAPTADLTTDEAAALPADQVLEQLGSTAGGLSTAEAARRLARVGPNAVRTSGHGRTAAARAGCIVERRARPLRRI
jgi:Cation transporter/ATPase, N-terminus